MSKLIVEVEADHNDRYPVVLLSRKPENYNPLVKEINDAGGQATGISTDITSAESVRRTFDQIKSMAQGAPVQCAAAVMNGAGSFTRKPFLELTLEEFEAGCSKAACVPRFSH